MKLIEFTFYSVSFIFFTAANFFIFYFYFLGSKVVDGIETIIHKNEFNARKPSEF